MTEELHHWRDLKGNPFMQKFDFRIIISNPYKIRLPAIHLSKTATIAVTDGVTVVFAVSIKSLRPLCGAGRFELNSRV